MLIQWDLVFVISSDGGKVLGGQFAELVVVNSTGTSQHHAGALVVGLNVVHQIVPESEEFNSLGALY